MRTAVGAILGIVLAFASVYLIELLGQWFYPAPAGVDLSDPESLREAMQMMPAGALGFVLLAWSLATLFGGTLAGVIARKHHAVLSALVGGLILAGAIANMILLPHPEWFVVAAVILIPLATWIAGVLGRRLAAPRAE